MPKCKALTNQIHYSIDGYYKPCCAFGIHNTDFPIREFTPQQYLNSEFITSIKNDPEHPGCAVCIQNENSSSSLRQSYDIWCKAPEGTIEFLDISLNNQCNLACRMCNSLSSSRWADLLGEKTTKNNFNDIIKNIDVTKLSKITYVGGEPFITPEIRQVLDFVVKNQIGLTFDTNCTFYPKKYENLLKQIPIVYASFSIDGVGEVNDFIRHGSDFKIILKNLKQWKDLKLQKGIKSITTVVQAYNLHDLKNIKALAKEYNMFWTAQLLETPKEMSINALPPDYIERIKDEVNEKFLENYCYDPLLHRQLIKTTKFQNKILGEINTIPGVNNAL